MREACIGCYLNIVSYTNGCANMKVKPKSNMSEEELDRHHAKKMAKKKAARDKIVASKTIEKVLQEDHTAMINTLRIPSSAFGAFERFGRHVSRSALRSCEHF